MDRLRIDQDRPVLTRAWLGGSSYAAARYEGQGLDLELIDEVMHQGDHRPLWSDEWYDLVSGLIGPGAMFIGSGERRLFVTIPAWLEARRRKMRRIGKRTSIIGGDWGATLFQVGLMDADQLDAMLDAYTDQEIDEGLAQQRHERASA